MYTREEREGILWEFHRSGLSVAEACRRLPLFPNRENLYRWLRMEEAGELAAAEMPDRTARAARGVSVNLSFADFTNEPHPFAPTHMRRSRQRHAPLPASRSGARSLVR